MTEAGTRDEATSGDGARPTFTVVTATFNNGHLLPKCLESVAAQQGVSVEQVVIDGGSSDGTAALLRAWEDRLGAWVSERDSGIAEAMNKGIERAHGEWLLFLHADDVLDSPHSLAGVLPELESSGADIVGFPIRYGAAPGRVVHPRGGTAWLRLKTGLLHQGTFIRRRVFDRVGVHDTSLKIAMDYDFFLRAWLAGVRIATRPGPIPSRMSDGGVSSRRDWPALSRRLAEERRIHLSHARGPWQRAGYAAYWLLYPAYKRLATRPRAPEGAP